MNGGAAAAEEEPIPTAIVFSFHGFQLDDLQSTIHMVWMHRIIASKVMNHCKQGHEEEALPVTKQFWS